MPCRQLVDFKVARYYRCIFRCVRRAFLWSEVETYCKSWIKARLEGLARQFTGSEVAPSSDRARLPSTATSAA